MKSVTQFLEKYQACNDGKVWLKTQPNMLAAWSNCERSDWLIWALRQCGYSNTKVWQEIAIACVCEIWDLLKDDCSKYAVVMASRYINGLCSFDDLRIARESAAAAAAADAAAAAAAAADAADAADAAYAYAYAAAADAAYAYAYAAADAYAYAYAKSKMQKRQCEIIRQLVTDHPFKA
jgi:hypothetical protein